RVPAVFLVALTLLVAGCGRLTKAGSGGIDHPTGAADLVLRMDVGGGFVAPTYELRRIPTWSLFGDGRIITEGPQIEIYPGPALPSVQVQTVTEEGIQAILKAAEAAGLLGPNRTYGQDCVADAPTTTFTVYADGTKHVVSAYALGMVPGSCPGEDTAARATLSRPAGPVRVLGDAGVRPALHGIARTGPSPGRRRLASFGPVALLRGRRRHLRGLPLRRLGR